MRSPTALYVVIAVATSLTIGTLAFVYNGGWTLAGAIIASRLTARFAFPFFLVAWSASSLAAKWPGGWRTALLCRRRAAGLSFAGAFLVHAFFFLLAILGLGEPTDTLRLIGGGVVYMFVIAMAITSNDRAMRALGRTRWKRLHILGNDLIAAGFAVAYLGLAIVKPWNALPALAALGLVSVLRISAWARSRTPKILRLASKRRYSCPKWLPFVR